MLMQVCLLLLSVGVLTSYADSSPESTTEDEMFRELDFIFPENFVSRFPGNSEFFTTKIFIYLFFNLFAKYFGEKEPIKFWSKFNHNDFNRVAIDAAFYEYLTKFADGKTKHLIYDPLASSTSSSEDIAIDRIGEYLDSLSAAEVPVDQSKTQSLVPKMKDCKHRAAKCTMVPVQTPIFGIPGEDFPNHCDIPTTSFTCADKLLPGIYADIETGCQVFHACWPHRIDSFLCPIGTTFNQALLTCDFWHESDCSYSPLLFNSQFEEGTSPGYTEPTMAMGDETLTTSESPSLKPELDIPEYDGTCQSLISIPLQLNMKFLPAKCKVTKHGEPNVTSESNKCDIKPFDRVMVDFLSGPFKVLFESVIKATSAQRPELKMELPTPKLHSRVKASGSTLKHDIRETSEKIHHSSIELSSDSQDKFPPQLKSRIVEKSVFKSTSQERVQHGTTVRRSTLLKPSKPSEETIKRVFDTMIKSLELGGKVLNEGVLPLVEKIVLDSHRKKASKS